MKTTYLIRNYGKAFGRRAEEKMGGGGGGGEWDTFLAPPITLATKPNLGCMHFEGEMWPFCSV